VLLDLDGVMVDSRLAIERAWRDWAAEHGADWELVERLLPGRRAPETVAAALPSLSEDAVAAHADDVIDRQVVDTRALRPVPGVVELVRGLEQARWGTVTSCPRRLAEARLRATGYPWPVPVLVAAEDVQEGKPRPEPYLAGARGLGVPPERCLVVEDSPAGIASAKAAGMAVLALPTTHPARELEEADALVEDGTEVAVEVAS
jgi:mannitol-1-/sugar-/sorbitol-6-phosphatase